MQSGTFICYQNIMVYIQNDKILVFANGFMPSRIENSQVCSHTLVGEWRALLEAIP